MSEKKEVLDYLRNLQKSAEIEAKVNGINIWVLLGAISIVSWQFLNLFDAQLFEQKEVCVRIVLIAEALYLFSWSCLPTKGVRNDLRYSRINDEDIESPVLWLVEGCLILTPVVLIFIISGFEFSVLLIGFFGVMITIVGIKAIFARVRNSQESNRNFPEPTFGITVKFDSISDLVFCGIFLFVAIAQMDAVIQATPIEMAHVRAFLLLAAFYLLCMVAIRRRRNSHGIQWTYELETDVLVGSVSPEMAIRRIENRSLGPKFEDVINKFFDEFSKKLGSFGPVFEKFEDDVKKIFEIPIQFSAERESRMAVAKKDCERILEELKNYLEDFSKYLEKLNKKNSDPRVSAVLQSMYAKRNSYQLEIAQLRSKFDLLLKSVS